MAYVDKKEALRNLSNPNDFNTYKNMFNKMYEKDLTKRIKEFVENNDMESLYDSINKINNISLYIGSNILSLECTNLLDSIKKNEINSVQIDSIVDILDQVYIELRIVK